MQQPVWTSEGPPHVGAMRIATAMKGLHYVLHAPQGDTYADLLFTMIERRKQRPPVTYTTFGARDLGGDTAELFKSAVRDAYDRFQPEAIIVGASCTAELIQDDPGGLASALGLPVPIVPLELPSYQKKENWGAAETFYQVVRACAGPHARKSGEARPPRAAGNRPSCNILGPAALGFRHRDDVMETKRLLASLGVTVNVTAPEGATPGDLARLGAADFNVVLYPEIAGSAAKWLERTFGQPATKTVPIGVGATRDFIREVAALSATSSEAESRSLQGQGDGSGLLRSARHDDTDVAINADAILAREESRLPWYSRSVDSTYLTGKRVFVFGDATHALAAARIAKEELGFDVVAIGTYTREFAREVRDLAARYGAEAIVSDDFLAVEEAISRLQPELVLGTQMERHIAKRLAIPCAVISAPVHVQDFPARYSPQMGFEGANVIFDTFVHPLMMGLEEHLLGMFREDNEFHADAAPSHLATGGAVADSVPRDAEPGCATGSEADGAVATLERPSTIAATLTWSPEAEKELGKIPFFVRGKARRNTETYARERNLALISLETLYDAKAHFAR